MNLKFICSYDGSLFFGSQKQPKKNTVEDELLKAFKLINIDTKIVLSGRTDKEVHATKQVFNCQVPQFWTDFEKLADVLNKKLPNSIKISKISKVDDEFNSRFYAKRRVYRYLITSKPTNPFNARYIQYIENIDEELLKRAIKEFIGIHDFDYFRKTGSEKENSRREIFDAKFYKHKDTYVFRFEANSYVRSQIRLMVGFLLQINKKKLTIEDLKKQLSLEKQTYTTPAPANGLYLAKIKY